MQIRPAEAWPLCPRPLDRVSGSASQVKINSANPFEPDCAPPMGRRAPWPPATMTGRRHWARARWRHRQEQRTDAREVSRGASWRRQRRASQGRPAPATGRVHQLDWPSGRSGQCIFNQIGSDQITSLGRLAVFARAKDFGRSHFQLAVAANKVMPRRSYHITLNRLRCPLVLFRVHFHLATPIETPARGGGVEAGRTGAAAWRNGSHMQRAPLRCKTSSWLLVVALVC